jgi:hypothetical protein
MFKLHFGQTTFGLTMGFKQNKVAQLVIPTDK